MHLGIGPIVTASIIMQLFVGAKIIRLNLSNEEDKAMYQGAQKFLVLVMILVESVPQVFGYLVPSTTFISGLNGVVGVGGLIDGQGLAQLIIIMQLFIGSYLVFLMDEVVSKWGVGSGISLFIAAGVAQAIFTGTANWVPAVPDEPVSLNNPPSGTIPKTIYFLTSMSASQIAGGGYEQILLSPPNPMIALIGTIIIFMFVAYIESTRIELPLAHGGARGARGRYPIKLLYASNIPVILMAALLANVSMFSLLLWNPDSFLSQIPLLGHNSALGYFIPGETNPAGGLAWYLSAPRGLADWLLPMLDPAAYSAQVYGHGSLQILARVVIYFAVMVLGSIVFAKFWIMTTNMGPEAVAQKIESSGLQIPGFRRDPRVLKRVLERYIPGGDGDIRCAGRALAPGRTVIGTVGNASGTGRAAGGRHPDPVL